jgi:hypothetical protein
MNLLIFHFSLIPKLSNLFNNEKQEGACRVPVRLATFIGLDRSLAVYSTCMCDILYSLVLQ